MLLDSQIGDALQLTNQLLLQQPLLAQAGVTMSKVVRTFKLVAFASSTCTRSRQEAD